jgi:subtilisin-like proprotein convertase family protein
LNVAKIKGEHDLLKHLRVTLISPSGTSVKLFENICGNVSQFNFGLNDEAAFPIACPPLGGGSYLPQESLEAFDGEQTIGDWTLQLEVIDNAGTGGTLENWSLEFCASISPNNPTIVNTDTIYLKPNETHTIFNHELAAEDSDNPSTELQFTIVDGLEHGYLSRSGVELGIGDHFTMFDVHDQKIAYTNTNPDAVFDFFTFIVEDGTGGWVGTPMLPIVIDENAPVGVEAPDDLAGSIVLAPNPATNLLTVSFLHPLNGIAKANVHDVQGRYVASQNLSADIRQFQVDLTGFVSGVYFLNVVTPEGVVAKKFVVEK